MITYLALFCPMIGYQFNNWIGKNKEKRYVYLLLGIFLGFSFAECTYMINYHWEISDFSSGMRRKTRIEKYMYYDQDAYPDYLEVQHCIEEQKYREVGIIASEDTKEYPLLVMLSPNVDQIMHVNVSNETGKYENMNTHPDCIIIIGNADVSSVECHGRLYDDIIVKNQTAVVLTDDSIE